MQFLKIFIRLLVGINQINWQWIFVYFGLFYFIYGNLKDYKWIVYTDSVIVRYGTLIWYPNRDLHIITYFIHKHLKKYNSKICQPSCLWIVSLSIINLILVERSQIRFRLSDKKGSYIWLLFINPCLIVDFTYHS